MKKTDQFVVHGVNAVSNTGGYEMQLDALLHKARVRLVVGTEILKPSRWCNIQEDHNGLLFIRTKHNKHYLGEFMQV